MTKQVIHVKHKIVDGVHCYTSTHRLAKGMCAMSLDENNAFEDMHQQMAILLELNNKMTLDNVHIIVDEE